MAIRVPLEKLRPLIHGSKLYRQDEVIKKSKEEKDKLLGIPDSRIMEYHWLLTQDKINVIFPEDRNDMTMAASFKLFSIYRKSFKGIRGMKFDFVNNDLIIYYDVDKKPPVLSMGIQTHALLYGNSEDSFDRWREVSAMVDLSQHSSLLIEVSAALPVVS